MSITRIKPENISDKICSTCQQQIYRLVENALQCTNCEYIEQRLDEYLLSDLGKIFVVERLNKSLQHGVTTARARDSLISALTGGNILRWAGRDVIVHERDKEWVQVLASCLLPNEPERYDKFTRLEHFRGLSLKIAKPE